MFEWRCAQLNEEVEQLKNGIRCHEVSSLEAIKISDLLLSNS